MCIRDRRRQPRMPLGVAQLEPSLVASGSRAPRRRRARAVYTLDACTLLIALGLIALRPPGPARGRHRVVVAPLENLTGDRSLELLGRVASQWIAQGLTQSDSLDVVSPATVSIITGDAKGSYADLLQLEVHVTDARTGRLIRALDPALAGVDDPIAAIDVLRDRVLGALAPEDRATIGLSTRVPRYTAYQEFLRGHERFIRYLSLIHI